MGQYCQTCYVRVIGGFVICRKDVLSKMLEKGIIVNGRYKIIDIVGKGGSSFVYLVQDVRIGKRWALKELPRADGMSVVLAKREVNMLKDIDYKMFPRITDTFVSGNYIYLISDFVEGISLSKVIENKQVDREIAIKWTKDIADALAYLHGLSPPVLYLDLKPDNVMVMPDGNIKMIDFGIAGHITGNYLPLGTPGYAAPEQYDSEGKNISVRTDIFALGMLYYTLRTRKHPASDARLTRQQVKSSNILNHSEKTFILKCTQVDTSKRYSCAQNVSYQLNQISKSKFNPGKIITYIVAALAVLLCVYAGIMGKRKQNSKDDAAKQMVSKASKYTRDGEYTLEGLKVITTFIDGKCLSEETENRFTYEVAMNYFRIQHDYSKAYKYFMKLDSKEYPEVDYLMEICRLQMEFEYDSNEVMECIGKLYESVLKRQTDKTKYEMLLFVSECYEQYSADKEDGIKKAITVLESGIEDMKSTDYMGLRDYEIANGNIEETYIDRLAKLHMKSKYKHNSNNKKEGI